MSNILQELESEIGGLDLSVRSRLSDRVRVSFGWGTMLTNDFRDLVAGDALAPFSLVCKAVKANGQIGDEQRQEVVPMNPIRAAAIIALASGALMAQPTVS